VKKSTVLNDGEIVSEAIYSCVVAGFEADEHVWIELRRKAFEHCIENARTQLRSAACGFRGGGEPDLFRQCHFSVEQIG